MLRVRIDILPHGLEDGRRRLRELTIINDGTGSEAIGNYSIESRGQRIGRVQGFKRARGPEALAAEALSTVAKGR